MREIFNKKAFHISMIIVIIVVILFIVGILVLRYYVEGETNLPFELTKITVISNAEGIDEQSENKWDFTINQNNDIYLYIEKNENYGKTEVIDNITLTNFRIEKNSEIGEQKIYKPDSNAENVTFQNIQENEVQEIIYTGDLETDIKASKISNQGGLIVLRYANNNIGRYQSNEEEEINHNELLKKIGINEDDLKTKITFDLAINLKSGKTFFSTVSLELPVEGIVENGVTSREITDLDDIIFKR